VLKDMNSKDGIVPIMVRSFVSPDNSVKDFEFARIFKIDLFANPNIGDLIRRYFSKNANQIGLIVINGKIGNYSSPLFPGDQVDLFGLIGGG
jgi:hypothetical protein